MLTDWDFRKRLESLNLPAPDFELIVLGSSLPEYGIDTELLTSEGIKSYNLAQIGNPIRSSYIQLNEYLSKYSKRPKFVLLGLCSFLERYDSDRIQPIVEFTMKSHRYSLKDVPIMKFNWFGVEIIKKILSSGHRKTKISYGQIKSPRIKFDNTNYNKSYLEIQKFESSYWTGEITKLCNQNGIKLIIIEMPGERNTQNLSDIGPYTLHFGNGSTAVLFNFNNQEFCKILDPDKDWVGISHFNEMGAKRFTKELVGLLK